MLYGEFVFTSRVLASVDYPEAIARRSPIAQYKAKGASAKAIRCLRTRSSPGSRPSSMPFGRRPPDMGKLDELRRSATSNIDESMGAGRASGTSIPGNCPASHVRADSIAGHRPKHQRRRDRFGQDRPRP